MSEEVEQATAAPGEKRQLGEDRRARIEGIVARLRELNVPESELTPILEWAADA